MISGTRKKVLDVWEIHKTELQKTVGHWLIVTDERQCYCQKMKEEDQFSQQQEL